MNTIDSVLTLYKEKKASPKEVLTETRNKINKKNKELNIFLTLNENVEAEAAALPPFDPTKYPLWGVPVSVKDNYVTKDLRTTASSNVLKNYIPPYDATVVTKLKNAGALIVGKTNMDAWAHGSSTETSDFGPTRNPHDPTRMPGGSSGGAAASVAAEMVPLAIGSETAGSIRQPAGWCGVVGLKPTYGRVSRYGLIAMASSTDCPGPITSTVEDAAKTLSMLAGKDPYDATTIDAPLQLGTQITKKYRIGWSKTYLEGADSETADAFYKMLKTLEKLGHEITEIELMSPSYSIAVYTVVQRAEVSSNLARFDGIRYGNDRNAFGFEAKKRITLGTYVLSVGYFDAYYLKAQKVRTKIIEDFTAAYNKVDAIVAPVSPTPALPIGDSAKYPFFGEVMDVLVEPSSIAGLPGITIPVGYSNNKLPIGMQIMTPWREEGRMIALAAALEKEYAHGL